MSDLRKAAEIALEALEWNYGTDLENIENCTAWLDKMNATIPALRQALAQPKQKQKTPLKVLNLTVFVENRLLNGRVYDVETLQAMTNRDILAIPDIGKKALGEVLEALNVYASDMSQERVDETAKHRHGACVTCGALVEDQIIKQPKRKWVGLTDDEITMRWSWSESREAEREKVAAWRDRLAQPKSDCKPDFDLLFEANSADIEALTDAQFTLEAIKSADPGTHDEIIDASLRLIKVALSKSVFGPLESIAGRIGVEL